MTATAAIPTAKPRNPHRISVRQTLEDAGLTIDDLICDSVVPACCDNGCEVEPDGRCEHGCPSVLMALGII
jgi:hypothetical protein